MAPCITGPAAGEPTGYTKPMPGLPVILTIQGRRCAIIGGGAVALRRARALLSSGAQVTVIAPQIDPGLEALAVNIVPREYRPGDLEGLFLVVIASNNPEVNQQAAEHAKRLGILVNRTDAPTEGDFSIPAHQHHGPVTLAVHTDGISATASAAIRDAFSEQLDPDWPRLLEHAAGFRQVIQENFTDPDQRRDRLLKLAGPQALAILKSRGEHALVEYFRQLAGFDD